MHKTAILFATLIFVTISSSGQTKINLTAKNGVKYLPCKVNGIELNFILDSGASDVSISLTEALFLIKQEKISEKDILGYSKAKLANGELVENTEIILRELRIGNITLDDVKATIVNNLNAPLLLGQSVISRLGRIDISDNVMTIYPKKKNSFNGKIYDISKILFELGNKFVTYNKFLELGNRYDNKDFVDYQFYDIDGDKNPEVVITFWGGGSSGAGELFVFTLRSGKCFFIDKIDVGPGNIFIDNSIEYINIDLFSYFYTCGSCHIELPNYVPCRERYSLKNNRLEKYVWDNQYNQFILKNLEFISNIKKDSFQNGTEMDNGERRACISQLYLYYLYNSSSKDEIYKLADEFYPFTDKSRIYDAINDWQTTPNRR